MNNDTWNPYSFLSSRNPSRECLKRIRTDMKSIAEDPLPGIFCVYDDTHATVIHAIIVGPFDTPYEGGFFHFVLNFPDDYPHNPPKVKLLTTGCGSVRFNPNLYANGKVCLSILGTWSGPSWSTVNSLGSVLISIQSLMNDKPFHNEPGYEQASNSADVMNYNACIRHETLRIAVIEMINPISTTSLQVPPQLRQVIRGLFLSFLESYQITCQQYMCDDGSTMIDPFGESRGKFCYGLLLNRINELAVEIESMDISTDSNENVSKICESKGDDDIES